MSRFATIAIIFGLFAGGNLSLRAVPETSAPQFREVFDLLRTNLAGVNENELNRAAVEGLIERLSPKVSLVEKKEEAGSVSSGVVKSSVFENAFGYVRLGQISPGADRQLMEVYRKMASTNRITGLIVDLRYSKGDDYAAAVSLADLFFSKSEPLIDWGEGMKKSTVKTNALEIPVALLVNRKTSGAAEAFAAILREGQLGVIIGSDTAGNASISKEFVLTSGQKIRVATTPVTLTAERKVFPTGGLKPDIAVEVNPDEELAWMEDSYKVVAKANSRAGTSVGGTNDVAGLTTSRPRRRLNEAELVRMLREGINPEVELGSGAKEIEKAKGIVGDPVLARALDLLKGLATVQQFRSS